LLHKQWDNLKKIYFVGKGLTDGWRIRWNGTKHAEYTAKIALLASNSRKGLWKKKVFAQFGMSRKTTGEHVQTHTDLRNTQDDISFPLKFYMGNKIPLRYLWLVHLGNSQEICITPWNIGRIHT
jgi:hypothetical protein